MAQPNRYPILDTVTLNVAFTTVATGAPIDPTSVTVLMVNPNGAQTQATYAAAQVVRDGEGLYHYDLVPAVSGWWNYQWLGTGTGISTTGLDQKFYIIPSNVIPG